MNYKVNEPIKVRYLSVNIQSEISDLELVVTSPLGVDLTPILMSEIIDSSGYPVTGIYEAEFTPTMIGWYWVRIRCQSRPENVYSKSYFVGQEYNSYPTQEDGSIANIDSNIDITLSTRASESTLSALNNKIGEVQETPTAYTLLARLKDIWDKLVSLFNDGVAKLKIWDGTNQAEIDTTGHLLVAGKSAQGEVLTSNPVSVSGKDSQGYKRSLLTDSEGRLFTVDSPSLDIIPVQILFQKSYSAINTSEWQEVLEYTIPSGYIFQSNIFSGFSNTTNERLRFICKTMLGSYDSPTNTFTDGDACTAPKYNSLLYIFVTSNVGNQDDTFTITYTNSEGITGRTATILVPKSVLAGTRIAVPLQTGDFGIRDITNITHTATGQNGSYELEGVSEFSHLILTSSVIQYEQDVNNIIIPENTAVYLQFFATSKSSILRRLSLIGGLKLV